MKKDSWMSIRLADDLKERIKMSAENDHRSLASQVVYLVIFALTIIEDNNHGKSRKA
jgi:predicted DNA-binding protein